MKPDHERIWLQPGAGDCGETTWCQDRVHDDDIEYVRKDIHDAALLEAHQRGLQRAVDWHRKNARICREIAQDDPRINETDRKRAGQAAIQHDASATGIEAMMIEDRRAKAQSNA